MFCDWFKAVLRIRDHFLSGSRTILLFDADPDPLTFHLSVLVWKKDLTKFCKKFFFYATVWFRFGSGTSRDMDPACSNVMWMGRSGFCHPLRHCFYINCVWLILIAVHPMKSLAFFFSLENSRTHRKSFLLYFIFIQHCFICHPLRNLRLPSRYSYWETCINSYSVKIVSIGMG